MAGKLTDWLDASPSVDTGWTFTEGGAEAGPLGLVVGFLLDLLVSIVLTVLLAVVLWLSLNVFVTAVVLLGTPLRTLIPCDGAAQRRWLLSLQGSPVGCCLPRLLRTPPRVPGEFLWGRASHFIFSWTRKGVDFPPFMLIPRFTSFCAVLVEAHLRVPWCRLAVFDICREFFGMGVARQEVAVVAHISLEMFVEEGDNLRVHHL